MEGTTWIAAGSLAVAVLALGISAASLILQRRAAGRAHFTGTWVGGRARVAFTNVGPGDAYDVTATASSSSDPSSEAPAQLGPISAVIAGQSLGIDLMTFYAQDPHRLHLTWRDNRGLQESEIPLGDPPARREGTSRSDVEAVLRKLARQEAAAECDDRADEQGRDTRGGRH